MKTTCPKQTPSLRENSIQKSKDPLVKISRWKKVTRLVRNYLPSIGLVLLLACVSIIIYLGAIGIPRFLLDKLEEEALKQGIELNIGSSRLGYGSGLSLLVRDTHLALSDSKDGPSVEIGRVRIGFHVSSLLRGEVEPYFVRLKRCSVSIPSSKEGEKPIRIASLPITCNINSNHVIQLATPSPIELGNLLLMLKADFRVDPQLQHVTGPVSQEGQHTLGDVVRLSLAEHREQIDFVSDFIRSQDWTEERQASLSVSYNGINAPRSSFELSCPSLYYDGLSFDDVSVVGNYSNETLIIHRLELNAGDASSPLIGQQGRRTKAVLQGGFNFKTFQISFNLESDMPLLSIASGLIKPEDFALIKRIALSTKDHSELMLKGDIQLKEDYSYEDATILGYILQNNVRIGDCHLNELVFSFFYKDGNFAVDKAEIKMGKDGMLSLSSHLREGNGQVDIQARLTLEQVLELLTSPIFELDFNLPADLRLQGPLEFKATAGMDSPDFAEGRLAMVDFLPEIDNLNFVLDLPAFQFDSQAFEQSAITGSIGRFYAFESKASVLAEDVKLGFAMGAVQLDLSRNLEGRDLPTLYKQIYQQAAASLQKEGLPQSHELSKLSFDVQIEQISCRERAGAQGEEAQSKLCLSAISAQGRAEDLRGENYEIKTMSFDLQGFKNADFHDIFAIKADGAKLQLQATGLQISNQSMESLAFDTRFESLLDFKTDCHLIFNQAKGEMLSLVIQSPRDGILKFSDLQAVIPTAFLNEFLPKENWESRGIQLGEASLRLSGDVELDVLGAKPEFKQGNFVLQIPELKRWGVKVKPHAKKINDVSLDAAIEVYRGQEGEYLYTLPEFALTQGSRSLSGSAYCKQRGVIEFDVRSNLLLDTLDQLIDDHLTHLIMRDFTMNPDSEVNIDNLKLCIDLRDGLGVKAHGDIELKHIDGLLGTYTREPDPTGTLNQEDIRSKEEYTKLQAKVLHGRADVDVDVQMGVRNPETGKLPLKKSQIDINNIKMSYDNRPWLSYKKIKGGVQQSSFTAKKVRIDTFENFVSVHQAAGTIYPDYSIGMYFAPLRYNLELLELVKPVDIKTNFCCFPISKTSKVAMDGVIAMESKPNFILKMLGESFPLKDFTGFIKFSKGKIYLDKLNAMLGQGVVDANVLLTLGQQGMGYDGYLSLSGGNLREVAAIFDNKQSNALVAGQCRFRGKSFDVDDLEAYGNMSIKDGDLLQLRIFSPISDLINNLPRLIDSKDRTLTGELDGEKMNFYEDLADTTREYTAAGLKHATSGISQISTWVEDTAANIPGTNYLFKYDLQHASATFTIAHGVLISDDLVAKGCNLSVSSTLYLGLRQMYLEADLWPDVSSLLTLMLSPVTAISNGIIDIKLRGTFDKLKWTIHWNDWNSQNNEGHAEFKQRTAHIKGSEKPKKETSKKP